MSEVAKRATSKIVIDDDESEIIPSPKSKAVLQDITNDKKTNNSETPVASKTSDAKSSSASPWDGIMSNYAKQMMDLLSPVPDSKGDTVQVENVSNGADRAAEAIVSNTSPQPKAATKHSQVKTETKKEAAPLISSHSAANTAVNEAMAEELTILRAEMTKLKKQVQEDAKEKASLHELLSEFEGVAEQAAGKEREKSVTLEKQMCLLRARVEELEAENAATKSESRTLEAAFTTMHKRYDAIKDTCSEAEAALRAKADEAANAQAKLDALQKEHEAFKSRAKAKINEANEVLQSMQKQYQQEARAKLDKVRSQHAQQLESLRKEFQERIIALDSKCVAFEQLASKTKVELTTARGELEVQQAANAELVTISETLIAQLTNVDERIKQQHQKQQQEPNKKPPGPLDL